MLENNIFQLIISTLIPWLELRGSIPYGILVLEMDPLTVFLICVLVNIALVFPTLVILNFVFPYIENIKIVNSLLQRARKKSEKYIDKYGFIGLALFVAIPLPGTGAYSGSIAAYIFNIKKRKAFPAISLGVTIAGILVLALTLISQNAIALI